MPNFVYAIIAVLIAIPVLYGIYGQVQKRKLRKRFSGAYIDWDNVDYDFESLTSIRKYWEHFPAPEQIDDTTWNDLDMDHVFMRMNATQSSAGEESLYARLRTVLFDEQALKHFGAVMDYMDENPQVKTEALCLLHALGKDRYNGVSGFIRHIDAQPIANIWIFYLLAAFPLVSALACLFTPAGFILLVLSFLVNTFVYYKNKFRLEVNFNTLSYIAKLTFCARSLSKLDFGATGYHKDLSEALKPLRKLNRLSHSMVQKAAGDLEALLEYIKIILMWDFIRYNRLTALLSKCHADFHRLFRLVGELDCAIAIGEYRKSLTCWTVPVFNDRDVIICEDLYHPLIKSPIRNDLHWERNAVITGSNASGKSTFVKALALTAICAQSLYLCHASRYEGRMSQVITSMAVRDKVFGGESYFMAEIKSLKRILDHLGPRRIICLIDEILKGTNTIERISASAAILRWLNDQNIRVLAASHDIELTEILAACYANYHFEETVTEDGVTFDYLLRPGAAKTRNAIRLLQYIGFDRQITDNAHRLAEGFEVNRRWEVSQEHSGSKG